jgi:hypothetical protein
MSTRAIKIKCHPLRYDFGKRAAINVPSIINRVRYTRWNHLLETNPRPFIGSKRELLGYETTQDPIGPGLF